MKTLFASLVRKLTLLSTHWTHWFKSSATKTLSQEPSPGLVVFDKVVGCSVEFLAKDYAIRNNLNPCVILTDLDLSVKSAEYWKSLGPYSAAFQEDVVILPTPDMKTAVKILYGIDSKMAEAFVVNPSGVVLKCREYDFD